MLNPTRGTRGMAVAPHALAAQSALAVLREGGNALEGMVAAAATIAVVYPHMNSLGGDSFWLVHVPGREPRGIDACGAAAHAASRDWYSARGIERSIPFRGGVAANTVAGTLSGWQLAFEGAKELGGKLPLSRLLDDAIHYAERGIPVTASQNAATAAKRVELEPQAGFAEAFLPGGGVPATGSRFVQPRIGATLRHIRCVCGKPCNKRSGDPELVQRTKMLVSPVWISAVSKSSIMPKPSESSACQPINERHGLCTAWRPPASGPTAPRTVLTTSPHSPRGDLLHPRP